MIVENFRIDAKAIIHIGRMRCVGRRLKQIKRNPKKRLDLCQKPIIEICFFCGDGLCNACITKNRFHKCITKTDQLF